MERPDGIVEFEPAAEFYPFESQWFTSSVGPIHYVDEGRGRPLLLLHGNPDWSFLDRKIVVGLQNRFRCIAVDYPGFGLSVHPGDPYGYTSAEHAAVVRELVEHLDLQDMVLMGQDWGGPIGMDVASRMPQRIGGLVMGNTWYWPTDSFMMNSFSRVMSSPPLQALITRRNFFVTPMMKRTLKAKLTDAEFDHYIAVVPTPQSRRGMAVFPKQIRAARKAGLSKATNMHSLRLEGPDKPGLGARISDAIAEAGINMRGLSAAAIGRKSVVYFAFDTDADVKMASRILKKTFGGK